MLLDTRAHVLFNRFVPPMFLFIDSAARFIYIYIFILCVLTERTFTGKKSLRLVDTNNISVVFVAGSFNFPRVSAQLKRLMGTNVVRLTDRNYMVDLRRRIQEDCAQMQTKRIETREVIAGLLTGVLFCCS